MEDTLAQLGEIQEEAMPDSKFIRPKRLSFEQAGAVRHHAKSDAGITLRLNKYGVIGGVG